jgi:hypothetical protein
LRIACLLRHSLYLRHFESALRWLAERGHEIVLVFSPLPKEFDRTLLVTLTREYPNIREEKFLSRTSWWWPVSDGARALRDCLRYFEPEYERAPALVDRGVRRLPTGIRWALQNVPGLCSKPLRELLKGGLRLVELALPPDPGIVAALRHWCPDLLIVSPMIDFSYGQTEYVKAARQLGIPSVLAVASWDNLTNKGVIQICPDLVLVWNNFQEHEAVTFHRVPPDRIRKTGAQLYDHWFSMMPSMDRSRFCAQTGLDPARPIILYLCSSLFICREEAKFVKEWLSELRRSGNPVLRGANVLVRPHPGNSEQWNGVDLSSLGPSAVWPAAGAAPIDDSRKRDYFDSLYYSNAVVGLNTSGFIEAGIVGRRTLTITNDHLRTTQDGTLHFHYLTQGGLLEVAVDYEQHFGQLARALARPDETQEKVRTFIHSFVRPAGLDNPATPLFVEAIEYARTLQPQPWRTPSYAPLLRAALWPGAIPLRRKVLERFAP